MPSGSQSRSLSDSRTPVEDDYLSERASNGFQSVNYENANGSVGRCVVATGDGIDDSDSVKAPLLPNGRPQGTPLIVRPFSWIWNSCTGCCLFTSLLIAASFGGLKSLSERFSVFQITLMRDIVALPVIVLFAYYQTGLVVGPMEHVKWVFLRGLCSTGSYLFYSLSIDLLPMSEASLLNDSYPALLAFLSWLLKLEKVDGLTWVGIFGAAVSQTLIARPPVLFGNDAAWDTDRCIGVLCCILGCIVRCIGIIAVRQVGDKVPSIIFVNHSIFCALLIEIPFVAAGYPKKVNFSLSREDLLLYGLFLASVLAQISLVRCFQIGPMVKASVLCLAKTLMMVVAGVLFFSEEIKWSHAVGGILLLASIVLVIYRQDRIRHQSPSTQ